MISVTCPQCLSKFNAPESSAGKSGKCPNCGGPIAVPAAQTRAPGPPPPLPGAAPAGVTATSTVPTTGAVPTVVVQMQTPAAGPVQPGKIGPADKSSVVAFLLWIIPVWGIPYFYLGQSGKGILFLLLDLLVVAPLIVLTCGLGLVVYIPLDILILVDALVVTSRIRKQAISPWRFF